MLLLPIAFSVYSFHQQGIYHHWGIFEALPDKVSSNYIVGPFFIYEELVSWIHDRVAPFDSLMLEVSSLIFPNVRIILPFKENSIYIYIL